MGCKHEYLMKTITSIDKTIDEDAKCVKNIKVGCVVYCDKCGKEEKRLSKKICKILANTIQKQETEKLNKAIYGELPKEYY